MIRFLFSFTVYCVICCARIFPILLFARAYIIVLYSNVGRKLYTNGYYFILFYFIFLAYTNVCSHGGWLLLKQSAIGIGFNGADTNCRIAHVLGILLMISY